MKTLRLILCAVLLIHTIACSAFKSATQPVNITCDPKDGVTLVVNGQRHECPITLEIPRNREFSIEGYKDGFLPYKRTISYHNSDTFMLDVIGTCIFLLPVIGLMTPGAKDLDETNVMVILPIK